MAKAKANGSVGISKVSLTVVFRQRLAKGKGICMDMVWYYEPMTCYNQCCKEVGKCMEIRSWNIENKDKKFGFY